MTAEARLFRYSLSQALPQWTCPKQGWLNISLRFHQPWQYANGKPKHQDVPNLIKAVLDGLAARYGFDDVRVWRLSCEKVEAQKAGIAVGIAPVKPST